MFDFYYDKCHLYFTNDHARSIASLIETIPPENLFYSPGCDNNGDLIKQPAEREFLRNFEYSAAEYKDGNLILTDFSNGIPF